MTIFHGRVNDHSAKKMLEHMGPVLSTQHNEGMIFKSNILGLNTLLPDNEKLGRCRIKNQVQIHDFFALFYAVLWILIH